MKRILLLVVVFITSFNALAQQSVFNRDNSGTGDWGSANLPWFYQTSNNSQGDPDNGNTTRNDVFIGHNNNTSMSLNGRAYLHRDFTFQLGASTARTLNNTTGGLFSFSRSLKNESAAAHIFNTPVAIDLNNAEINAFNASGSLLFNGSIFTNNFLSFVRGAGTITFTGAMIQGGSFVKQGTGTFILSGNSDFSGNLFIDEGTLRANRNLGTGVLEVGGGLQISTGFNAAFEVNSGTFSKAITIKNIGTGAGNRTIRFVNTAGKPNINTTIVLEKSVELSSAFDGLISGAISGPAGITKVGNGNLDLIAQNTFSGLTTVSGGTLQLNRTNGGTLPSSNNVIIGNGATLRISSNQTLGAVTINGGTITVDDGVELIVNSLTTTGTAVINGTGTVKLIDFLTVSSGTFTTNDKLILRSTSLATARVTSVGGSIIGQVTVERFIQGRRAFRFLTPSVTTTTSIRANWQNGGATTAGIGTHITGSTTSANGFDQTVSGAVSMHTYNAQVANGTGFTAIPNTNVLTLNAGTGYRILIRGDRNVDLAAASVENMNVSTTLSATGTLTTGPVTFNALSGPALINNQAGNTQTAGFTLIGNPYASPVDWHAVTKTEVAANAYYTWDPTLGTTAQRGRYVVYSEDTNSSSIFQPSIGDDVVTNRRFLQTGQAVFVKNANLNTPATLTFEENDKASNYQYAFRLNQLNTNKSTLFLSVFEPNMLALGGNAVDGAAAVFGSGFSNDLDSNDVEKLLSTGENIAFSRNDKNLAIETLATAQNNDLLSIKTIALVANKNYTFALNPADFDASLSARLLDSYLNSETPLSLSQPSFINFSTTSDEASYGTDRFKIIFNSDTLGNNTFVKNTISVYPNPVTNNQFTVALPSTVTGKVTLSITNMLGQRIYDTMIDAAPTMEIQPKKTLQNGVYIVNVTNNGSSFQIKIIVKN